jgi:LysM repeat protein
VKRYLLPSTLAICIISACNPQPEPTATEDTEVAVSIAASTLSDSDAPELGAFDLSGGKNEEAIEVITAPAEDGELVSSDADQSDAITEPTEIPAAYPVVKLRRGETLAHFARWSGLTVESIADASMVDLEGDYPVGLEITLPVTSEEMANIADRREKHRVTRVDGYLASRGGSVKSDFYTVQSGDNAWVVARKKHGIPVWVLESFNPSIDLDKLRPGQPLMVPVIADTVVDAE